ncbi:hypothetical protein JVT61DRAFT_6348 [Boletus reticuloceps]|uniref:Mitochondrial import inner membrane translocase subunit TIM50 n=1 Tax=Boletus reticuloceps TaxID=495285 RepID=A0A8I2YL08_9AGAM|nr:hypothetical protein JVT61DRAFT_6348 [Boletus reticuloceps]
MSRSRRRRGEPAASHWEPGLHRPHSDEYRQRRYAPPSELLPRDSFNYWREDFVARTSYYPQRSYGRESYNELWHDDSRSWHAESSYSRPRRHSGLSRDQGDRSPPHRNPPHHRYSTCTPYIPRPTIRPRSPIEPIQLPPKPVPPESPRKALSPPDMSCQPPEPSPGYLSLSEEPSEILHDPAVTRKLLVLDLNGTLLIRSPRSRTTSGLQLRPVQPRPYMQSFRQYLFCLPTKAWLDTMVWSSAQPHSVDDMVDKVFGTTKGELKTVWNRKSLGLSEADYREYMLLLLDAVSGKCTLTDVCTLDRKALTTKDLTKPWDLFASALAPENFDGHSAVSPQSRIIHSALTTLLLDDSPHKAVLQPYSHVCIPEYDSTRRQHDLRSFLATREHKKGKRKNQVEATTHSTDPMIPEPLPLTELAEKESYDVILLAVIGILETMKLQSNVAGWIRSGGLWATQERGEEGGSLDPELHSVAEIRGSKTVSNAAVRAGNDASSKSHPAARSEQAHPQARIWFNDSSVVAFWVARGRRALMELGIPAVHGMTG